MIKESREGEEEEVAPDFSFRTMLAMAVATSIDALAIGVSFAFLKVDIWMSVLLIGITTCLFSMIGINIGNVFGSKFKSTAELLGGIILVVMGIKILIEHIVL
jgi:putative Mn2+ efflux pump MntP